MTLDSARPHWQTPDLDVLLKLSAGVHNDPFAYLGLFPLEKKTNVQTWLLRVAIQDAQSARALDRDGVFLVSLTQTEGTSIWEGVFDTEDTRPQYQVEVIRNGHDPSRYFDAYAYPPNISTKDLKSFSTGVHTRIYELLGAHPEERDQVQGVRFCVWAPNAQSVSVVGDFNGWNPRSHSLSKYQHEGLWWLFVPGAASDDRYQFVIHGPDGTPLPWKADPVAFHSELAPAKASIVTPPLQYEWNDHQWMGNRAARHTLDQPISIYELHLGSWRRAEGNRFLNYEEIGALLIPYVKELGFTHIELMPIMEYPFDGSWGYQTLGLFAPTCRHGSPEQLCAFIDRCHQEEIGVILDWVPGHFPCDEHGLARFDGTCLYEHEDPRRGFHPDWKTALYQYGRNEVRDFLISSALYWLDRFHFDGLRVDAVASMLYLDYSRENSEWVPNEYGGREHLEAIELIKRLNELVYSRFPGAMMIAEESTAWPGVSAPTYNGGLGFGYKWNMGWMNDTLRYIEREPIHRSHHHELVTFGMVDRKSVV